jgi:hypothetical protein
MGTMINADKILVGRCRGKRSVGMPGVGGRIMLKTDLREVGCDCADWIYLAQYRIQSRALMNTATNTVYIRCEEFIY